MPPKRNLKRKVLLAAAAAAAAATSDDDDENFFPSKASKSILHTNNSSAAAATEDENEEFFSPLSRNQHTNLSSSQPPGRQVQSRIVVGLDGRRQYGQSPSFSTTTSESSTSQTKINRQKVKYPPLAHDLEWEDISIDTQSYKQLQKYPTFQGDFLILI
jgi:hypothetical protein